MDYVLFDSCIFMDKDGNETGGIAGLITPISEGRAKAIQKKKEEYEDTDCSSDL